MPCPTEHEEQVAFFQWAAYFLSEDLFELLFAIPNGGHRHKAVAGKLKAEGVKPGVPDIFFAWPHLGFHGLWIELKRKKGGSLSAAQKDRIEHLRNAGYRVDICKGFEEAEAALKNYMLDTK